MRRLMSWLAAVGVLTTGAALVTQVSTESRVEAAVNGAWSAIGTELNGRIFVTYQESDTSPISSSNPLYVGGAFTNAGGDADADYLAKWDGSTWSKVATTAFTARGGVYLNYVASIVKSGSYLYVGGVFAAGTSINIARITIADGTVAALGTGMAGGQDDSVVEEITVIGTKIYAGGAFGTAGGVTAGGLAVWDTSAGSPAWAAVGGGLSGDKLVNGIATDGTTLYVGGQFDGAASPAVTSKAVMSWNGTAWSAMSTTQRGFTRASSPLTAAMLARSATEVYAAGRFTSTNDSNAADQITLNGIAKWDGSEWSELGTGISGGNAVVETLAYKGSTLWVGGDFTTAGGVSATNIAKWDGTAWDSITCGARNGVSGGAVRGIAPQSDGSLIVAGGFTSVGAYGFKYIAKFTPGADNCPADAPTVNFASEPVNVRARLLDDFSGVVVSWGPPISDGGTKVVGYHVSTYDGRMSCYTTDLTCTLRVSDVPEGVRRISGQTGSSTEFKQAYLAEIQQMGGPFGVFVQAETAVGRSRPGLADRGDRLSPPAAPTEVRAAGGNFTVTVSWKPPVKAHPLDDVTNYLARVQPGGEVCITRVFSDPAAGTVCTFNKLTPGIRYTFTVQALSQYGWGSVSAASNAASPFGIQILSVAVRAKPGESRGATVVATANVANAKQAPKVSWRVKGTQKWTSTFWAVKTKKGKEPGRYTYTIAMPSIFGGKGYYAAGKTYEFRVESGKQFSEVQAAYVPGPYDLRIASVKVSPLKTGPRRATVVAVAEGWPRGQAIRLWVRAKNGGWSSSSRDVWTVKGLQAGRHTYTTFLPARAAGRQYEFRLEAAQKVYSDVVSTLVP